MTLRLGTDERQAPTASPEWYRTSMLGLPRFLGRVPRWARIGPEGVRGEFPSGTGHAVPEDSEVALCGTRPTFLWAGAFDPRSRVVLPCARCAEARDEAAD